MYAMGAKNMVVHIEFATVATKIFSWNIVPLGNQEENVKINLYLTTNFIVFVNVILELYF